MLLAAKAMPSEAYTRRISPSELTFGEVVAFTANVTSIYCERLSGRPAPPGFADETQPKDTLTELLAARFTFCRPALASIPDDQLGDVIRLNGPKTRAAVMVEATAFWSAQYQHMNDLLRRHGHIPPTPCTGAGGPVHGGIPCGSGLNQCLAHPVASRGDLQFSLADGPFSVRSDGRGPYRPGDRNVLAAVAGRAAAMVLADPFTPPAERRAVSLDLDHPAAGGHGMPHGVIRDDNNLLIITQWKSDGYRPRSILDIPLGTTVAANEIAVEFHINGLVHVLQAGPEPLGFCFTDGTAVTGDRTTPGTITRADSTTWTIELPVGSVARLFDVSLGYPFAVDKGLFDTSLRFVLSKND